MTAQPVIHHSKGGWCVGAGSDLTPERYACFPSRWRVHGVQSAKRLRERARRVQHRRPLTGTETVWADRALAPVRQAFRHLNTVGPRVQVFERRNVCAHLANALSVPDRSHRALPLSPSRKTPCLQDHAPRPSFRLRRPPEPAAPARPGAAHGLDPGAARGPDRGARRHRLEHGGRGRQPDRRRGRTTSIGYSDPEPEQQRDGDPENSCNAKRRPPATLTVIAPAAVTVTPASQQLHRLWHDAVLRLLLHHPRHLRDLGLRGRRRHRHVHHERRDVHPDGDQAGGDQHAPTVTISNVTNGAVLRVRQRPGRPLQRHRQGGRQQQLRRQPERDHRPPRRRGPGQPDRPLQLRPTRTAASTPRHRPPTASSTPASRWSSVDRSGTDRGHRPADPGHLRGQRVRRRRRQPAGRPARPPAVRRTPPVTGFPVGTTTLTCSATDKAGNTGTSDPFDVVVTDTTAPEVTTPANIVVGNDAATVTYDDATATDLVDGAVAASCTPASGTTFALGTTTVTCTATDKAGNTGSEHLHRRGAGRDQADRHRPGRHRPWRRPAPNGATVT